MFTTRIFPSRFSPAAALPALALIACLLPPTARAQSVAPVAPAAITKLEFGASYSRGDFGLASDTEVLVAPVSVIYETKTWTIRATLPWVRLEGPAALVADGGAGAGGPVRPDNAATSGLGDSSLGFTYKTTRQPGGLHTDWTARVKFPTGDEDRGLGTGEIDYHLQVDLYQSFDRVTPFFTAGYRILGDGRYQLDDGFFASAGAAFLVAPGTSLGASLNWRQRIVARGDDAWDSTLFAYRKLNENWSGTIYAQKGFTNASADYGMGLSLIYQF